MITEEKVKGLDILVEELETTKGIMSEQIRTAQDRNGENLVKLKRNGKDIELTEKTLWEELYHGGYESEGGQIISKLYPEIFKLNGEIEKLVEKLNVYTAKEFGFFFSQMSPSNLLNLINGIVEYKIKNYNLVNKIYAFFRKKGKE